MGVTRSAPWWLTWALSAGLVLIFAGERIIGGTGSVRLVFSIGGFAIVLGCVVWRIVSWLSSSGDARRAETTLLAAYGGIAVALVLYVLSSSYGMRWLGIEFEANVDRRRYTAILGVIWPIVMAASLLPALGSQLALAAHRHAKSAGAGVEALRVRGMARAGLTVALVAAFLMVSGYIATARDRSLDLSYFRTSSPGDATKAIVQSMETPLRVLLFYPEVNQVKDEALRYFQALARSDNRIVIESHDRLVRPDVAREFSIAEDGMIALAMGNRIERLMLGVDFDTSTRNRLRTLDREVQQRLLTLLRPIRTVYFTSGHGELNDPASAGPLMAAGLGGVEVLKQMFSYLNYDVMELGIATRLTSGVPDDAAAVVILGPQRSFLPEEMAAIDRYLERGGKLLLALDLTSGFELGPLERRLGVRFERELMVDDFQHLVERNSVSDRQLIITNWFSSHSAVATAARASVADAAVFLGAGHLTEADTEDVWDASVGTFATDSAWLAADQFYGARPTFLVRSLPTTFADLDGDFEFDEGVERRRQYNLVAAVEALVAPDSAQADQPGSDAAGSESENDAGPGEDIAALAGLEAEDEGPPSWMRALVFADARIFTDAVLTSFGLNAALVADAIRWLGGEERFAGGEVSEEDVPIRHTRAEDVAWFYSTILGAPALVLILGLTGVYIRRRRSRDRLREAEVSA